MSALRSLDPQWWPQWTAQARSLAGQGTLPTYIPPFAVADPSDFGVYVGDRQGIIYGEGNLQRAIPWMSGIKPFVWLYGLHHFGEAWAQTQVADRPSAQPFNSLEQLQADQGYPRNALVNSGAICLAGSLPGATALEKCHHLTQWLESLAPTSLRLNESLLAAINACPNPRNQAIADLLAAKGYLPQRDLALETYHHLCCLESSLEAGFTLGRILLDPPPVLAPTTVQRVCQTLAHSGLYEASPAFFEETGWIAKSAVSGLMMAILPPSAIVIGYSPPLDSQGHSIVLLAFLRSITQGLKSGNFSFPDRS